MMLRLQSSFEQRPLRRLQNRCRGKAGFHVNNTGRRGFHAWRASLCSGQREGYTPSHAIDSWRALIFCVKECRRDLLGLSDLQNR